jgi:hypothetical protein
VTSGYHHGAANSNSNPNSNGIQSASYNRVKYTKGASSGGSGQLHHHHHPSNSGGGGTKTTGASGMVGQGINGGTIGNQLRNGLNPTLRGYSPSRPRWKVATAPGNNNNY